MYKKIYLTLLAATVGMLLSSQIFAGDAAMKAAGDESHSAKKLMGLSVVSQQDEKIGEIQDIMLDIQSGRITFVTLSKGGVLGIGGEEGIAVPLEALRFDPAAGQATLTVDKNKLENAPKQADMSSQDFQRELQSHYGVSPAWQRQDEPRQMMQLDEQKKQMKDTMQKMQDEGTKQMEKNKY